MKSKIEFKIVKGNQESFEQEATRLISDDWWNVGDMAVIKDGEEFIFFQPFQKMTPIE